MLHILLGLPYHHSDDFLLRLELRGLERLHPHVPMRATPITPEILLEGHAYIDINSSLHCCVWSCSLILFFSMARLGSILPAFASSPHVEFLTRDRVNFCEEGLVITLLHTKTIQFGKRRLHIPLLRLGSSLCPFEAYLRVASASRQQLEAPAFVYLDTKGQLKWLTKSIFIHTFRALLSKAGHKSSAFSGHSFRRGGASWAFQSVVPGELIQILGDWASDAYKRYLEFSVQNKLDLAALFIRNLPK